MNIKFFEIDQAIKRFIKQGVGRLIDQSYQMVIAYLPRMVRIGIY